MSCRNYFPKEGDVLKDIIEDSSIDRIPEIYCSIVLSFDKNINIKSIIDSLNSIGISDLKICEPKFEPIISVEIAIVDNECFWDMNDALMKMFSKVNKCMIALKKIVEIFSGKACIDISFCQYGTYPAMVVSKEIIKKIDFLEADLSIDPY